MLRRLCDEWIRQRGKIIRDCIARTFLSAFAAGPFEMIAARLLTLSPLEISSQSRPLARTAGARTLSTNAREL